MTHVALGERLRSLREERSLSLRDVAAKAQLDAGYLSRIERGEVAPPSSAKLRQLAKALRCSEDALLLLAGRLPANSRYTSLWRDICTLTPAQLDALHKFVRDILKEAEE